MKLRQILPFAAVALVGMVVLSRCGGSSSTATTYASTSTKGDFAQWTVDGNNVSATWQVISSTGAVNKTLTINATCGAADATYLYKTCTVSSASCANGATTCSAGDAPSAGATFYAFEVPGTAFMVKAAGGGDNELHVGYVLDTSCSGVAGDYSFLHLGNRQTDLFGIYRTNADFSTIQHADFMAYSSSCNSSTSGGGCTANNTVFKYSTGSAGGVESITSSSCSGGVRTVNISGNTLRVVQSQSGVFIMDLPSGQGGLLAFKTSTAAALSDFASKNFAGIAFPDNSGEQLMTATTGAVTGGTVPFTTITFKDGGSPGITNPVLRAGTDTTNTATAPTFPDFTATPTAGSNNYSTNTLSSTYATPSTIPGLFRMDGTYGDAGRVMLMATKVNNKVLAFGMVYNWRRPADSGFSSLPNGANYYNTGAFILFEK